MSKKIENDKKQTFMGVVADLKPAPYNPRRIEDDGKTALGVSLDKFGDISGITWNQRTENLVTGHQRVKVLKEKYGEGITIDNGEIVTPKGERFKVRVVDWSDEMEKQANIAANSQVIGGAFEDAELQSLLEELEGCDDFVELRLADLMSATEEVAPEGFPEVDEDISTDHECPKCGYKWSGGK